ncbi:general odorant-binding protein 19d-like [Megachile rotundata]|uniref:general odorant-binding protein 19d-like n=1 Tax=Megachile rotundata TaxID=143995 RepID=UPI000258D641|nr:PREDICTED: uncharacterized protein LOC100881775 [Megachile rotundata]
MKGGFIVLGVLLIAATIRAEDYIDVYLGLMKEAIQACAKENGYTDQNAREIFDKEMTLGEENATCLRACVMKMGAFMHHSKINKHNVNTFLGVVHGENPELLKKLEKGASECIDKVDDIADECKKAYVYIQCFLDKHQ